METKFKIQEIIGGTTKFLDRIHSELEKINLDVSKYEIDHICYRVSSQDRYELKKRELADMGELLSEAMVNGRPIATYKLKEPILYKNKVIPLVELPSPKPGSSYKEGLEHCEFVVPEGLQNLLKNYQEIKFNISQISNPLNPDVSLKLNGVAVKFHPTSLEKVIEKENQVTK